MNQRNKGKGISRQQTIIYDNLKWDWMADPGTANGISHHALANDRLKPIFTSSIPTIREENCLGGMNPCFLKSVECSVDAAGR